ncbi:hypothetical protein QFZ24_002707 [Streptomyces phaeochromogenes]|uniref:hypothetical protein n=1 Tax=Streptomyces phaeochromogenes TaxID=1923 RepID=UPI00278D6AB7|nr:hypothetical protein [Streptomyces phaeochromogenes]MDQ0948784.1 hypothetical protein [Streptomyces phaeochromogenes]
MADKGKHGFVRSVRRFFWLPRDMPRRPAAAGPLVRALLFGLAMGAVFAVFTPDDDVVTPSLMTVIVWVAMLDDVIKGVRHRWPAFLTSWAVCWSLARLLSAKMPGLGDSHWDEFAAFAPATAVSVAVFVEITRLPQNRRL